LKKKILIFRTDRTGDLLLSLPLIYTLKDIYNNSSLCLVCSKHNYTFAKNIRIFEKILIFPLNNIIKKIKFIYDLIKIKYDIIIVLDGKNRSIFSTVLLKSSLKICKTSKKIHQYICKFFNIKYYHDSTDTNLAFIHQKMLDNININKKIGNYDYLNKQNFISDFQNLDIENFIHLHFDEKWFLQSYIKNYTNIEPDINHFIDFLNELSKLNNVVVTTGIVNNNFYNYLVSNYCVKISDKKYTISLNKKINFILFPSFNDLINISKKSKILITCHGSMTHVANCFNVKIIDIIEKKKEKFDARCTSYIKNYSPIYREKFEILKKNILDIS
tara:strand:- start:514 stop:1503 length:990 start_codon:yes stop_codon:yes gene_type:complete